jgi:HD-like signal output (HDOD) protein/CheY-like chemotaxis protein
MPLSILFVDDEPQTLRGLQRLIRAAGLDWRVAVALSGEAALEILDRQTIDVLVTDLNMPGLSGRSLLTEIARRHPAVLRIVLTAEADPHDMMAIVAASHAVLCKPCPGDLLISRITRAAGLRRFLDQAEARALVSGLPNLPALPRTYLALHAEMERAEPSESRIVAIIDADPPVAAQFLHVANSAYFAPRAPIQRTLAAVRALGYDIVRAVVLERGIIAQFDPARLPPAFDGAALWSHSFQVAALARKIATINGCGAIERDAAFTAGLLHDLGWLIVAANRPVAYQAIAKAPRDLPAAERADIERRCAGATHAEFAAYLLGLWGLPDKIVEAVAYHHAPLAHIGPAIGCDGALLAVHIANALVDADPNDPLRGLDSGLALHPLVTTHQAEWIAAAKSLQT